jgi:hypothetical protein
VVVNIERINWILFPVLEIDFSVVMDKEMSGFLSPEHYYLLLYSLFRNKGRNTPKKTLLIETSQLLSDKKRD